jgi:hypothetical protein
MSTKGEPASGFGKDVDRLNKIARQEREQEAKVRKKTPPTATVTRKSSLLDQMVTSTQNKLNAPKRERAAATVSTIRSQADAERRLLDKRKRK